MKLKGKTRTKVEKWTREFLDNDAIIGNISVRLDPTKSKYEMWYDEETGHDCLTITEGVLDCAVDSLSRIKAILGAADNPLGSFALTTRFQVRIWLVDDASAAKVATIYNDPRRQGERLYGEVRVLGDQRAGDRSHSGQPQRAPRSGRR